MHATTVYKDTMKVHFYKYKFLLVLFRKDDTLLLYIRDTIEISNQIQPHAKYYYFLWTVTSNTHHVYPDYSDNMVQHTM